MKIAALLANGFEEIEAITTIDVLRRAGFHVDTIALQDLQVTGSHGITVVADRSFEDQEVYDVLFLPGGQPGVAHLSEDPRVIQMIQTYMHQNKIIAAICAAPLALQKAGILNDKNITSYPMKEAATQFKEANYLEDNVVVDGNLITSRGVGTALDFAFALVEHLGKSSENLRKSMVYHLDH